MYLPPWESLFLVCDCAPLEQLCAHCLQYRFVHLQQPFHHFHVVLHQKWPTGHAAAILQQHFHYVHSHLGMVRTEFSKIRIFKNLFYLDPA